MAPLLKGAVRVSGLGDCCDLAGVCTLAVPPQESLHLAYARHLPLTREAFVFYNLSGRRLCPTSSLCKTVAP